MHKSYFSGNIFVEGTQKMFFAYSIGSLVFRIEIFHRDKHYGDLVIISVEIIKI